MTSPKHGLLCALCLIFAVSLPQATARHQETGDGKEYALNGILHLGGRECETGQSWPCIAYFELNGDAARQLYENMRVPARTDLCTEGFMKTDVSGLHCYSAGDGDHGCYFGYDFYRRRIVEGEFSC